MKNILTKIAVLAVFVLFLPFVNAQTFTDVPANYWAYSAIDFVSDLGVMNGVTSSTFAPTTPATRASAAVALVRAFNLPLNTTGGPHFTDVPATNWAYAYIETLYNKGLSSGCGSGKYCPDQSISRAAFVVLLVRSLGLPLTTSTTSSFPDVSTTYWAFQYIQTAQEHGIVVGYTNGNFGPEDNALRDQLAVFLNRAMGGAYGFTDVPTNYWAYLPIMFVAEHGIMNGVNSTSFAPTQGLKRDAAAVVLVRALGLTLNTNGGPHFSDVPTTHWAYAYIETLYNNGITSGCATGKYCPNDYLTRTQLVVLFVRGLNLPLSTTTTPHFPDVPATHFAFAYIQTAQEHGLVVGDLDGKFYPEKVAARDQAAVIAWRALAQPGGCAHEGLINMEIGDCVILNNNGYKVVLSDISGTPQKLPATFKIYDAGGNLVQTLQLYAPPGEYYRTQYGFSIDVQNIFSGVGQTAYAQVYIRSWTQYNEFMKIGDSAYFQGVYVTLRDISGFPTDTTKYSPVTFRAFGTQGQLLTQFDLQRGQTIEVKVNGINGLVVHLLTAFAGIGKTAYAVVGFTGLPTETPTPTVTPTRTPANATTGTGETPASEIGKPASQVTETFSITLHKGWNLISTPIYGIFPPHCQDGVPCVGSPVGVVSSTTCAPATLWHIDLNGQYVDTGKLAVSSQFTPHQGYWTNVDKNCEVKFSKLLSVGHFTEMSLSKGWNQIGWSEQPTAFAEIKGDCKVTSGPLRYNTAAGAFEKAVTLQPGEGYFLKTAGECSLAQTG